MSAAPDVLPTAGDVSTQAPPSPPPAPRLSVVVPTYRQPLLLLRCLSALCAQTLPRSEYEVVVVDDGHDDATREAVAALAQDHPEGFIRYMRPVRGRGPAVARNYGWQLARGDVVAFTDDDTEPAADWLREGLTALDTSGYIAIAGRIVVPRTSQAPPTDHELTTRGLEAAEFATANAFVHRRALFAVGGFDERFSHAWREDSDLQFRLQQCCGPVGRCETAVVEHPVRPERWGVALRQQKNVYYDALLYREHPRLYRERLRAVPPWDHYAIVASTIGAMAFALVGQPPAALLCAAIAIGGIASFAVRRLAHTSRERAHVVEMIVTSALIPFLSVWWRMRGALHLRAWFP